jgi:hypothetical protein
MTQNDLNRAVASATGETVSTVARRGFSLVDPTVVEHDPNPCTPIDVEDRIVDWDALDAQRSAVLV